MSKHYTTMAMAREARAIRLLKERKELEKRIDARDFKEPKKQGGKSEKL